MVESEKQKLQIQADSFRLALDGLDTKINTVTEALAYARQEDDYSAQTKLESDLAEMRQIKQNILANQQQLGDPAELDRQFQEHVEKRRQQHAQQEASEDVQGLKRMVWMNRHGVELEEVVPENAYQFLALTPGAERMAVSRPDASGNIDIWVRELASTREIRLTTNPASDNHPTWSPDGKQIAFESVREGGVSQIYVKDASGAGEAKRPEGDLGAVIGLAPQEGLEPPT